MYTQNVIFVFQLCNQPLWVSCRMESKSLDTSMSLRPVYHGADPGHGLSVKQRKFHERRCTGNHRTGVSTWCRGGCSPDGLRAEIRILDAQSSVRRKLLEVSSK